MRRQALHLAHLISRLLLYSSKARTSVTHHRDQPTPPAQKIQDMNGAIIHTPGTIHSAPESLPTRQDPSTHSTFAARLVSTSLASGSASAASAIFLRGMLSDGGARCPARTTSESEKFRSRERPARPPSCAPSEPARGSVPMLPMTPSRTVSGPELADRTVGTVLHGMTASIRQAARREIVQK